MRQIAADLIIWIAIPRLKLRKKGPAETLEPIFKEFNATLRLVSKHGPESDFRDLVLSVSHLLVTSYTWATRTSSSDEDRQRCKVGSDIAIVNLH
jgi:hypothetical protein